MTQPLVPTSPTRDVTMKTQESAALHHSPGVGLPKSFVLSALGHVAAVSYLVMSPPPAIPPMVKPLSVVTLSPAAPLPQPKPEPAPPEPLQEPSPPPPKPSERRVVKRAPTPERQVPRAEHNPEPPQTVAPIQLEGVGFSNLGMAVGVQHGPAVATRAAAPAPSAPRDIEKKRPTPPKPPELVPLEDLSQKPRPPALSTQLKSNYPRAERARGVAGHALVRLVLSPAGRVEQVNLLSESSSAFGTACRKTLLGTHWSPPRDKSGRPVRTSVRYRCRFEVDQ